MHVQRGADGPQLSAALARELARELAVLAGTASRLPFVDPGPQDAAVGSEAAAAAGGSGAREPTREHTLALLLPAALREGLREPLFAAVAEAGFKVAAQDDARALAPDDARALLAACVWARVLAAAVGGGGVWRIRLEGRLPSGYRRCRRVGGRSLPRRACRYAGEPRFEELVAEVSSGPVVALVLARAHAVQEWLDVLGPLDPDEAQLHPSWYSSRLPCALSCVHTRETPKLT